MWRKKSLLSISALAFIVGCGGGGGSTSTTTTTPTTQTVTGTFVDGPVEGLGYKCSSSTTLRSTNSDGEYTCNVGDTVTFYIGRTAIGSVTAQETPATPYSLSPQNITAAINIARVLQTIDDDSRNDRISINSDLADQLPSNTNFGSDSFQNDVENALSRELVSAGEAQRHMDEQTGNISTNTIPVANAGEDQNVIMSTTVSLDGSESYDKDGDNLTYTWSINIKPSGSIATLSDIHSVKPTFTAGVVGTYEIQLLVNDGELDSSPDKIIIVVTSDNSAPIANAGVNQNVEKGTFVTLDGSNSYDANNDPLTYTWTINRKPSGSAATLSDIHSVKPTFTADLDGTYDIQLLVNDGELDSRSDTVRVTASSTNDSPIADAGPNQSVTTSTTVVLDGSNSYDPNQDSITYKWAMVNMPTGSNSNLSYSTSIRPRFIPDQAGTYVVELVVNDGELNSVPDRVSITAYASNAAPVGNAGPDQSVTTSTIVTLDGSNSYDSNNDTLSFSWSIVSKPTGSSISLSNATASKPTFTANLDGSYVFELVVNDGQLSSAPDRVSILASSNVPTPITGDFTLLAWNDLGMHCFDGKDFSIFSILPPYNNLNAQLIKKEGTSQKHITSGVTITYQALEYDGHINTTSEGKTNFWGYVDKLFPGASTTVDTGLTGNKTPSETPQPLSYNSTHQWWEADGIPIVSYDDDKVKNFYPMVQVVAKSGSTVLDTLDVVLPVSDEMDCAKCHASSVTSNAAKPTEGWVNYGDSENNATDALRDYKLNILRLHDEKYSSNSAFTAAINSLKPNYDYNASLEDTALSGTPVLCATCHKSNALGTSGFSNIKPLTQALHGSHATAIDADPAGDGLALGNSNNRTACYSCHPGSETLCLRGAMGSATNSNGQETMQCQSCHGTMSDVGSDAREGWLDQPNCQVCHQNGERYESALVNGTLRAIVDTRFATNPNKPINGTSLYRFSTGHGNLQCSACHGSTHAIYPTSHAADNIASEQIQGHLGTIGECSACHSSTPNTTTGGPHGMHPVGSSWVHDHEDVAERNSGQCATCHGSDYKGSVLSKTFTSRSFSVEGRTKTYNKGDMVTCYDCHDGPDGGDDD